jgi:hypothetical protein
MLGYGVLEQGVEKDILGRKEMENCPEKNFTI